MLADGKGNAGWPRRGENRASRKRQKQWERSQEVCEDDEPVFGVRQRSCRFLLESWRLPVKARFQGGSFAAELKK